MKTPSSMHRLLCSVCLVLSPAVVSSFGISSSPGKSLSGIHLTIFAESPNDKDHVNEVLPANHHQDRRGFVMTSLTSSLGISFMVTPHPAQAAYGTSSNMELPNYIEFLMEKNAVADPNAFLYQGPDPKIQLGRLLEASKRLQEIPTLANDKKWSQVQGILTGPLGTLAQTLNFIAKDNDKIQASVKKVKEDIFAINQAAAKKNAADVVAKTSAAQADLEAFVKATF